MRNYPITVSLGLLFSLFTVAAYATPEGDRENAYTQLVPLVLNRMAEPVHGEHVEYALTQKLKEGGRFHLAEEAYAIGRDLAAKYHHTLKDPEKLKPLLHSLGKAGADGVVLVEVVSSEGESYSLNVALVNAHTQEFFPADTVPVGNSRSLESFARAARWAMAAALRQVPFDGAVLRREGYRVVLDRGTRGFRMFRRNMRLGVFTLEPGEGGPAFRNVGEIRITRAETQLGFATILTEKTPGAIGEGNKVRVLAPPEKKDLDLLVRHKAEARVAHIEETKVVAKRRSPTGELKIRLGANLVHLSNAGSNGQFRTQDSFFPVGEVAGEVWITKRIYAGAALGFSMTYLRNEAGQTPSVLSANANNLRGVAGYRIRFLNPDSGPQVSLEAGYARQQFSVDVSTDSLGLNTATYTGVAVGGGVKFPLFDGVQILFGLNAFLFPSVVEAPFTSGAAVTNVSAWEFSLGAGMRIFDDIDLEATARFQDYGAEFSGTGTRPIPLTSMDHSIRGLHLAVTKYF